MKALTFNPQTDQFEISELPTPRIDETDVLIQVDACGLNPVDSKISRWKSMVPHMDASWVPGLDVSGHIVEIGKNVTQWKVGDQVLYHGDMLRPHGGFAEFAVQDAGTLIPHPNVSSEMAAATPCAGWTAWRALNDKLRIKEHNSILVMGGSGGVGGFALQIAAHFNLETIITTCSASNHRYVKGLGAIHVIDYKNEDVVARILEITNQEGVALGLDTVGNGNDVWVANSLAFEGQMVSIVNTVAPADYQNVFMKGLSFHQLSLGSGHRHGPSAKRALTSAGRAFSDLLETKQINVPVLKIIGLEQVGGTLTGMLQQRTVGKIVMKF